MWIEVDGGGDNVDASLFQCNIQYLFEKVSQKLETINWDTNFGVPLFLEKMEIKLKVGERKRQ